MNTAHSVLATAISPKKHLHYYIKLYSNTHTLLLQQNTALKAFKKVTLSALFANMYFPFEGTRAALMTLWECF